MNLILFFSLIATSVTIIGFVYVIVRKFRNEIRAHLNRPVNRLEKRRKEFEFESKMNSLDETMLSAITGKKLEDAILEKKNAKPKN